MADFFTEYFIDPIVHGTGYNIVNTITFAIILIIAVWILIKLLNRLEIKLNRKLWFDLLPFVLLGGITRALQDIAFFEFLGEFQFIFVTPLIYIVIFAIAFVSLLLSKYWKDLTRYIGITLLVIFTACLVWKSVNWSGFAIIMGLTLGVFFAAFIFIKVIKSKILNGINWMPLFAHTLDSSASVAAITIIGGYREQHVVPGFIFQYLPFWSFIIIKVALILLVLYVIDKETKKGSGWNWMLKFTVFVLGMGPGLRNTLSVLLGSNL